VLTVPQQYCEIGKRDCGEFTINAAPFPLIWCRSLANAHNTIISAELRLSTPTYPIDCCKKLSDLLRALRVRLTIPLNNHCDVNERYPCRIPLYMFFLNAQVWGQAQGHIRCDQKPLCLHRSLNLDMAKLRTNSVCRTMSYIPSYRISVKVVSLCLCARTSSRSCDTFTVQITCNYTLSTTPTFTWRSDRGF
jgi:hypothetical protein